MLQGCCSSQGPVCAQGYWCSRAVEVQVQPAIYLLFYERGDILQHCLHTQLGLVSASFLARSAFLSALRTQPLTATRGQQACKRVGLPVPVLRQRLQAAQAYRVQRASPPALASRCQTLHGTDS